MITKAIDVIKTIMSDDCVEVLEHVEKYIQGLVALGREGCDHTDIIRIRMPISLTEAEESCVRLVLQDAGWTTVTIRDDIISFYFPY